MSAQDLAESTKSVLAMERQLFRFIHHRRVSLEDAEDLTQESLISAIVHLELFDGRSDLIFWVLGIARNKVKDFRRKVIGCGHTDKRQTGICNALEFHEIYPSFEDELIRQLDCDSNLALLEEDESDLLRLRYIEGYSLKELCMALNKSLSAIQKRLAKAKNNCRQKGNWAGYLAN